MKIISSVKDYQIPEQSNNASNEFIAGRLGQERSYKSIYNSDSYRCSESTASKEILSSKERTTLHFLFGTEKPDDMEFYGQNKVSQINKGQLIDITG